MPKRIVIRLDEPTRVKRTRQSQHAKQAYERARAKAILLVAEGMPLYKVVDHLYIRVHRNAVSEWVRRFIEQGVDGLKIRKGRGRKSAFSPPAPSGG